MRMLHRDVFIPLVELHGNNNELLQAYAGSDISKSDRDIAKERLILVNMVHLHGSMLFEDGVDVYNKLKRIVLKPPKWSIWQRFKPISWLETQTIHMGNVRLNNCEGNSAQLGFAIALLLNGSNTPVQHAIATGNLKGGSLKDNDVAIGVVGSVPEKLDLIIEERKKGTLPTGDLYCFTPTYYIKDSEKLEVVTLPQIKSLAELGIEVKPIEWLSDAQKILKAETTQYLPKEKLITGCIGIVLATLLAFVFNLTLHYVRMNSSIPIQILAAKDLEETHPYLVCTSRDNQSTNHDLPRDGNNRILPIYNKNNPDYQISLAWRLMPKATLFDNYYYMGFIQLGEKSGFFGEFIPHDNSSASMKILAGKSYTFQWPMQEVENADEEDILILVFQRTPFDASALKQTFYEQFPDWKTPPLKAAVDKPVALLDIAIARDFLTKRYPQNRVFYYKSTFDTPPPCTKPKSSS